MPVALSKNAAGFDQPAGPVNVGADGGQVVNEKVGLHDRPTTTRPNTGEETFWDQHPSTISIYGHHDAIAINYDGKRGELRRRMKACDDEIKSAQTEMDIAEHSFEHKFPYHVETDDRGNITSKKAVDWRKPYLDRKEAAKAKKAEYQKQLDAIPRSWTTLCDAFAHKAGRRKFKPVPVIDVGDMATEDARAAFRDAKAARVAVDNLGSTKEEIAERVGNEVDARAAHGAIQFAHVFSGLGPMRYPQRQEEQHVPGVGMFYTSTEDVLSMLLALDDGKLKKRIIAQALEANGDRPSATADERARMAVEADARVIAARRTLEACCVRDELAGLTPHRPKDTDATILLWLEAK